MASILVVDSHKEFRVSLTAALRREGYEIYEAESGAAGLAQLAQRYYDLVISDLKLPDVSGLEVVKSAREQEPRTEVMVITSYGSIEAAVEAMKMGAIDFVAKPVNLDQLLMVVRKALERKELRAEVKLLREKVGERFSLSTIVARSAKMQTVLGLLPLMAASASPVLIMGETGTGKELVAKALHSESLLADKPLVTVNCAALPETLMESELFGHSRGAFTGAFYAKKGMLAEADGGTIFLDEVGEMSLATQVKVLRFLEAGEIRPVGGNRVIQVRARVLAATNQNLEQAVKARQFREELYYRLNVLNIHLPPLRERREDIPVLVDHFLKMFQRAAGKKSLVISAPALERLVSFPWPGNVRQMRNVIERAVILARGRVISPEDISLPRPEGEAPYLGLEALPLTEVEKRHILNCLKNSRGNQARAARVLGISKITLWRKLKEYGVDPKSFQP